MTGDADHCSCAGWPLACHVGEYLLKSLDYFKIIVLRINSFSAMISQSCVYWLQLSPVIGTLAPPVAPGHTSACNQQSNWTCAHNSTQVGRGPFWTVVTVPAWTLSPLQEEEGDGATQTPVQIITEKEGTRKQA